MNNKKKFILGIITTNIFFISGVNADNSESGSITNKPEQTLYETSTGTNSDIETKRFLTDKQRETVTKKLDGKNIIFYNKLIEKIDDYILRISNETLKFQLEELKDMTQIKIDQLNKL
ncbi:MAG: hypothetical protein PHZ26_04005 [Candidatus Gracilibacteria bacterium]|nr:hypothetical protein [Candidatus Gracilibacteria bacterium]MDD2908892.1 hypothetical protein [Candidatus Gracilibacteria bacterium]